MFNGELPEVTPLTSAAATGRKCLVWKHRFKNSAEQRHVGSTHHRAWLGTDTQRFSSFLLEGKTHVLAHGQIYHTPVSRDSRNHDPREEDETTTTVPATLHWPLAQQISSSKLSAVSSQERKREISQKGTSLHPHGLPEHNE